MLVHFGGAIPDLAIAVDANKKKSSSVLGGSYIKHHKVQSLGKSKEFKLQELEVYQI